MHVPIETKLCRPYYGKCCFIWDRFVIFLWVTVLKILLAYSCSIFIVYFAVWFILRSQMFDDVLLKKKIVSRLRHWTRHSQTLKLMTACA